MPTDSGTMPSLSTDKVTRLVRDRRCRRLALRRAGGSKFLWSGAKQAAIRHRLGEGGEASPDHGRRALPWPAAKEMAGEADLARTTWVRRRTGRIRWPVPVLKGNLRLRPAQSTPSDWGFVCFAMEKGPGRVIDVQMGPFHRLAAAMKWSISWRRQD